MREGRVCGGVRSAQVGPALVLSARDAGGPVFGVSWELCQFARQQSQEAVSRGFPPSWPDLHCANTTYTGPDSSYSHGLRLSKGRHTLWAGLLLMVRGSKLHSRAHLSDK